MVRFLLASLLAIGLHSDQSEPGQILGVVKDVSGAALPGVTVTLSGPALPTARTATAASDGSYQFAGVMPGTYTLKFELGTVFFPLTRDGVVVAAGKPVQVNVSLALGPNTDVTHANRPRVRVDTSLGAFVLELDADRAPKTVENFLKYVDAGYYTGGRFHRATRPDNYVPAPPDRPAMQIIQGGINPDRAKEAEASIPPVPLERTTVTGLKHVAGVVSMARGAAADSGRSDFFILLDDQPSMDVGGKRYPDGQGFAAFGRVVDGLDVVRKINAQPVKDQALTPPVPIRSITRMK